MILYDNKSLWDILFRLRGSAFMSGRMWIIFLINVVESVYFSSHPPMEFEGVRVPFVKLKFV
jgi:hypothetical protein